MTKPEIPVSDSNSGETMKAARREKEAAIAKWLDEGWSVPVVARAVGASQRTIARHKTKMRRLEKAADPLLRELEDLDKEFGTLASSPSPGVLDILEQWKPDT